MDMSNPDNVLGRLLELSSQKILYAFYHATGSAYFVLPVGNNCSVVVYRNNPHKVRAVAWKNAPASIVAKQRLARNYQQEVERVSLKDAAAATGMRLHELMAKLIKAIQGKESYFFSHLTLQSQRVDHVLEAESWLTEKVEEIVI